MKQNTRAAIQRAARNPGRRSEMSIGMPRVTRVLQLERGLRGAPSLHAYRGSWQTEGDRGYSLPYSEADSRHSPITVSGLCPTYATGFFDLSSATISAAAARARSAWSGEKLMAPTRACPPPP